jgi:hypothetical protein
MGSLRDLRHKHREEKPVILPKEEETQEEIINNLKFQGSWTFQTSGSTTYVDIPNSYTSNNTSYTYSASTINTKNFR